MERENGERERMERENGERERMEREREERERGVCNIYVYIYTIVYILLKKETITPYIHICM